MYTVVVSILPEKESAIIVLRQIHRLRGTHMLITFSKIWRNKTNLGERFINNSNCSIVRVNDPRCYLFSLVRDATFAASTVSRLTYIAELTTYFNSISCAVILVKNQE